MIVFFLMEWMGVPRNRTSEPTRSGRKGKGNEREKERKRELEDGMGWDGMGDGKAMEA